jgi:hypothetical protein
VRRLCPTIPGDVSGDCPEKQFQCRRGSAVMPNVVNPNMSMGYVFSTRVNGRWFNRLALPAGNIIGQRLWRMGNAGRPKPPPGAMHADER